MSLSAGTRLGPYEVTAQIGVGGMGEVYRATDTKLKRQVAIKVLPASLAADPDRLARFQREAEVLASLNHPHIAAIYGLEDADGVRALVMELVEGPTLADRITQGAIPLEEALPIAKQIAEALEAAHEQGIIHRDLKPANIKVRDDGTVIAAISCGIYQGTPVLDLDYIEDSNAGADANFVLTGDGNIAEAQATAEGETYDEEALLRLLRLARIGCTTIFEAQDKATGR